MAKEIDEPSQKLFLSIVELANKLAQAFPEQPPNDPPEHERARYIHALNAMSDFLRANRAPLYYAQRLYRLAVVLNDLNNGKVDLLVTPTEIDCEHGGNPGKVTTFWLGGANAALGMIALIVGGSKRQQAALSAKQATGLKDHNPHKSREISRLLNWYDEFRKPAEKRRIGSSLACELFDHARPMVEMGAQASPAHSKALASHFFALAAVQLRKQA